MNVKCIRPLLSQTVATLDRLDPEEPGCWDYLNNSFHWWGVIRLANLSLSAHSIHYYNPGSRSGWGATAGAWRGWEQAAYLAIQLGNVVQESN